MPRAIKEPSAKRNEILDEARRLVYSKGYEQMTIQDILDDLQISKGAFYYYFDSKQVLLEALINRMGEEGIQMLAPIFMDPQLSALEKFHRYFDTAARWKTEQKDFLLALLRGWYADENAIVRQKMLATTFNLILPYFNQVIRQGIEEGVFSPAFPDQVGSVIFSLMLNMGDAITGLILDREPDPDRLDRLMATTAAFSDAMERILGAPAGSLILVDRGVMREWVVLQPVANP